MKHTPVKAHLAIFVALIFTAACQPWPASPSTSRVAAAEATPAPSVNLLSNPSFEDDAKISDELSLPGWELGFRRGADQPLLTADEVVVIDDPQAAHSGRRFLRIQSRQRELALRSPQAQSFEPGLYEVSAWVRGRPGTLAGFALDILGANFGAGVRGVNGEWQKFSLVVYSPGVSGRITFPEQTQLFLASFHAGERDQIAEPLLDVDDISITRLTSGLADTYGDHMVLQRKRRVPLRGWAKQPGQSITVEFNGQTKTTAADQAGYWRTVLEPMKAGGPYVLKLDGRAAAFDVMVGDVWICSGQSNMEFGVNLLNGYYNSAGDHRPGESSADPLMASAKTVQRDAAGQLPRAAKRLSQRLPDSLGCLFARDGGQWRVGRLFGGRLLLWPRHPGRSACGHRPDDDRQRRHRNRIVHQRRGFARDSPGAVDRAADRSGGERSFAEHAVSKIARRRAGWFGGLCGASCRACQLQRAARAARRQGLSLCQRRVQRPAGASVSDRGARRTLVSRRAQRQRPALRGQAQVPDCRLAGALRRSESAVHHRELCNWRTGEPSRWQLVRERNCTSRKRCRIPR